MVEFGSGGYFHAMDREYGSSTPIDNSTNDAGIGIKDLGFSLGLGPIRNVHDLGAKMRTGMKTLELTFMGMGKGSAQGHTPGTYGERQRQALREMQKANRFDFTVHSSVGITGMAGMDREGNFSKEAQKRSLDEIKRAVDFASDVAGGGAVVVHSGEYFRHMADAGWNKKGKWANKFEMHPDEEERASFKVIDSRTGSVALQARKNRNVSRPIWKKYEKGTKEWEENQGKGYKDIDGNWVEPDQYVDYLGRAVERDKRVPVFDEKEGHFKTRQMTWKDVEEEAKEMTRIAKQKVRDLRSGKITKKEFLAGKYWTRFVKAHPDEVEIKPQEAYVIATLETNAANSRGFAFYYGGQYDEHVEQLRKLKEAKKFYEQIDKTASEATKKALMQQGRSILPHLIPADEEKPTELINRNIKIIENQVKHAQESAASQWAQAEESEETMRHIVSSESYAKQESYRAYADAAIRAMKQSEHLERRGELKKPIALAVENLFPEAYGAHPDELIELIKGSRKKMAEVLQKKFHYDKERAVKEAKEHLYATFDTAHFNMWWKYWKEDEKKTSQENRKEFEKWYLERVEDLAKEGVVGHLHLVDNLGYDDEHLAPGEGNVPIKKAIEIFKKHGFKGKMIVEPGADFYTDSSGQQTLLKAWRHFGSPVYGTGTGIPAAGNRWENVQYRHFGQNQPPYFVFQPYSPSEDWTLWSGVQFE